MIRHRRDEPPAGDEYGPVTDLVFSLFAVAVLVLGIVGTDGAARRRALAEAIVERDDAIADLTAERDAVLARVEIPAPPPPAPRPAAPPADGRAEEAEAALAALSRARAELDARGRLLGDLEPELARARADAAAGRSRGIVLERDLAAAAADRDRLAAALDAARAQAADLDRRLADVAAERDALRRATYRRLELATLAPPTAGGFLDDGRLAAGTVAAVRDAVRDGLSAILEIEANRIAFEVDTPASGEASSDPLGGDFGPSVAVAAALVQALRAGPVPVSCVAVLPFGKSRASAVAAIASGAGAGGRIAAFDRRGAGPVRLEASERALAEAAALDARIVVVAETLATSPCDHGELAVTLDEWTGGGAPN